MKNILLVTDDAYTYSGREKIFAMMARIYNEENKVTVYSLNGEGETFYSYDVEIKTFNRERNPLISVCKDIKNKSFDYIFIVSMGKLSFLFSIIFSLYCKKKECKIIACEHVALGALKKYVQVMKLISYNFYDQVILLTEKDARTVQHWSSKGIVIYNPIIRKEISKKGRSKKAIAIGRLVEQKNFSELIDIWGLFYKSNIDWSLSILGDGEQYEFLQEKINSLGLEKSITLHGRVNNVDDFFIESDLCLMTSHYEGLPLVLLEAKSYAVPCIAYDCPTGPEEIIYNGDDGFLIPQGDKRLFLSKLNELAHNDDLYFSFSKNTIKNSNDFDYNNIKAKWLDLIK